MATEYKLSYTASEINEKLGRIPEGTIATQEYTAQKVDPVFEGSISLNRTEGSIVGENSVAIGNNVAAQTEWSVAFGKENISGTMGYYISCIFGHATDSSLSFIYLSTVQPTAHPPIDYRNDANGSIDPDYLERAENVPEVEVGADIYITVPWTHYTFCGKVQEVIDSAIIVKDLITTYTKDNITYNYLLNENEVVQIYSDATNYAEAFSNYANEYDYMICIPSQPTWGECPMTITGFAAGRDNKVAGDYGFAEGTGNIIGGAYGHAEGLNNKSGYGAHAEGGWNESKGFYSHSEGSNTKSLGYGSHSEGVGTQATAEGAHSEGGWNKASGQYAHSEGSETQATAKGSHAEGIKAVASGLGSHAEGYATKAITSYTHAEGESTYVSGWAGHAEGLSTRSEGEAAHSEGRETKAIGTNSHAEGYNTKANSAYSHAEGFGTTANGLYSHTEGHSTETKNNCSHAEGSSTKAYGSASHTEGWDTKTTERASHAHAEGEKTIANGRSQHVQGKWNVEDTDTTTAFGKYAHIIGNGTAENARSNAHTLDWNGNAWYAGTMDCTGVILTSPNGTRYKITVDNNGNLTTTKVTV